MRSRGVVGGLPLKTCSQRLSCPPVSLSFPRYTTSSLSKSLSPFLINSLRQTQTGHLPHQFIRHTFPEMSEFQPPAQLGLLLHHCEARHFNKIWGTYKERGGQKAPLRNTQNEHEPWIVSKSFSPFMPPSSKGEGWGT